MNRKPSFAGAFYTDDRKSLLKQIDEFTDNAETFNIANIKAVISPHAGYIYSGNVAGFSYRQIRDFNYDVILVLALSHRGFLSGGSFASVIPEGTYETPVSVSEIDSEIGGKLLSYDGFTFNEYLHKNEHSLEVQVPFIQRFFPDAKIVPVLISTGSYGDMEKAADVLNKVFSMEKRSFVTVISTDLSHFHDYDTAVKIDRCFIESLKNFDSESLYKLVAEGNAEACGIAPVITGMLFSKSLGADRIAELKYANSGDSCGERNRVVGYLSAAVHGGN